MIAAHALEGRFVSLQTADGHPSKPHPAMLEQAMADTGVAPDRAIMVGDTSFDIEMAGHAGIAALGVGWGYHPAEALWQAGARAVAADFSALTRLIEEWSA